MALNWDGNKFFDKTIIKLNKSMALSKALIHDLFPKVEFAFFGSYINRYKRKVLQKVRHTFFKQFSRQRKELRGKWCLLRCTEVAIDRFDTSCWELECIPHGEHTAKQEALQLLHADDRWYFDSKPNTMGVRCTHSLQSILTFYWNRDAARASSRR